MPTINTTIPRTDTDSTQSICCAKIRWVWDSCGSRTSSRALIFDTAANPSAAPTPAVEPGPTAACERSRKNDGAVDEHDGYAGQVPRQIGPPKGLPSSSTCCIEQQRRRDREQPCRPREGRARSPCSLEQDPQEGVYGDRGGPCGRLVNQGQRFGLRQPLRYEAENRVSSKQRRRVNQAQAATSKRGQPQRVSRSEQS